MDPPRRVVEERSIVATDFGPVSNFFPKS